ncbi:MAG: homocysteine S-methyltransferase family protein [Planctomycetes bacterium]|nr:homocysteine S-methyltransferase family protein [Planctomycetota bacterium]
MSRINLKDRIEQGLFLLDGAMGTQLIARGVEPGKCNDFLNVESPDVVSDVYKAYLDAGSDAIITNTFGANKFSLARHGFGDKVDQINAAAAKLARDIAGEDKYVLGGLGPSGDFLQPLGNLKPDELKQAFAEQVQTLLAGGVDGFIIETMTALDEIAVVIEAVKSVCDLPVLASMSFDIAGGNFRTMMGVDVESAVSKIASLGVTAAGFNCGKMSLDEYVKLAEKFVSAANRQIAVLAEPNAGLPELVDGGVIYNVTPDDFAAAIEKIHSLGVNIIGGCCGTTPAYIEALAKRLKSGGKG